MAAEDSIIQQQVWVVELRSGPGCRAKVRVRVWRPAEDSIIQQQVRVRVWRPAEDSIIQQQVGVKVRVCRPARVWVRVHGMAAEDSIIQQQVWVVELRSGPGCRAKVRVRVWRQRTASYSSR
eukprot:scaffold9616_cov59-Phaeocystis_antarctica.AAC.3